ncbi:MAG: flagellar biosynthesis protein FliQ [Pedosphaera sp.]|jgi:flagellar biosynthetic protein FliQ|nr:flagellar biosynthesis protein FliQ [Pedosphaera sp.]
MNPETAVEIIKSLILNSVTLASPILMTALVIGLGVSVFQAVTSIHEQTLSFVPKALAVLSLIVVMLPWMVRTMIEFTRSVIEQMPQMVG